MSEECARARRGRRSRDQRTRRGCGARPRWARRRRARAVRARPSPRLEPRALAHLPALVPRARVGSARAGGAPRLARARGGDRRAADRVHRAAGARRDLGGSARRVRGGVGGTRAGRRERAVRDRRGRARAPAAGSGDLACRPRATRVCVRRTCTRGEVARALARGGARGARCRRRRRRCGRLGEGAARTWYELETVVTRETVCYFRLERSGAVADRVQLGPRRADVLAARPDARVEGRRAHDG